VRPRPRPPLKKLLILVYIHLNIVYTGFVGSRACGWSAGRKQPGDSKVKHTRTRTTRAQDIAYLRERLTDAFRAWQVGDACLSYNLQTHTTIVAIERDIATLANGDHCHVTKLQSIR
jgi:hypothetical protein